MVRWVKAKKKKGKKKKTKNEFASGNGTKATRKAGTGGIEDQQ